MDVNEMVKKGLNDLNQEIDNRLDALKKEHGASTEEVKAAVEELKNAAKEADEKFAKSQEQLDALTTDLKKADAAKSEQAVKAAPIRTLISENFDAIAGVRKGNSVKLETKAVGDMTLGASLTGDQPREYSSTVAAKPGQMLNVSDLIQAVNIGVGTYTFPRESGGEGAPATQIEGSAKAQVDYDLTMVDVNTDFIAGYARYSRKMANNLPFLESFLPNALRRDYWIAENSAFNTVLAAGVTASSQVITSQNKIEMLIAEVATLEGSNFYANGIVVTPADFYDILTTEKSTGAGYGLPGVVAFANGQLTINGIPVFRANWLAANKYYVGDWSGVKKVVTEGLGVEFSQEDGTNFRDNMITARVEAQVGLAIERTDAVIYGDFTAT